MVQKLLLEVKNLEVNFYTYRGVVKALNGVNLKINEGEFFGLVGETGCGKSVTASAVLNLVQNPGKIEKGEIIFQGKDLLKIDKEEFRENIRGKEITMIMQYPIAALNPVVNNGDQISEALLANLNITRDEAKKRTIELLKDVNIPEPEKITRQYPHRSVNERASVHIARYTQRLAQPRRTGTKQLRSVGAPSRRHDSESVHGFERPDEDCCWKICAFGDSIEAPVHAIYEVDVCMAWRPEHGLVPLCAPVAIPVRGGIVGPYVCFHLGDAPGG